MIAKTIQKKEEYYIQFTDEEMDQLGFKPNTKFTVEICDDKQSLKLTPHVEMELDLSDYSKEELLNLIYAANQKDQTIEDFIVDTLTEFVNSKDCEGSIL